MLISEKTFNNARLIYEVIPRVIKSLSDTLPEMQKSNQILKVVEHEFNIYKALRKDVTKAINFSLKMVELIVNDLLDYPGLNVAYKNLARELEKWRDWTKDPEEYAFKLYESGDRYLTLESYWMETPGFSWKTLVARKISQSIQVFYNPI